MIRAHTVVTLAPTEGGEPHWLPNRGLKAIYLDI